MIKRPSPANFVITCHIDEVAHCVAIWQAISKLTVPIGRGLAVSAFGGGWNGESSADMAHCVAMWQAILKLAGDNL